VKHGVHIGYTQQELYLMGRVTPYQPMRAAAREVSEGEMWETLAKRGKGRAKSAAAVQSPELKHLEHEMWLANKLGQHGVDVFTGDTDQDTRKQRFREAIFGAQLASVVIGKNKQGNPETYESCFARLFGEPL
jgi:hypothetical protein